MIYFCADDYGVCKKSNNRIEECIENGALNKISILPNGESDNFVERFKDSDVTLSLHINLVEGIPLSDKKDISLLTSKQGFFKHSFIGLLLLSISPFKKCFKKQVYTEIKNQLEFWRTAVGDDAKLTIDSHQHTHMIPLIFKTLLEVIKEEGLSVKNLRFPSEPLLPYLLTPSLYRLYKPSGLIKQWLLKFLGFFNRKALEESGIDTSIFMGVLFSGSMTENKVQKILPHYIKIAKKRNKDIELLFHPGYLEWDDKLAIPSKKGFYKFYFSPYRKAEFDALVNLDKYE